MRHALPALRLGSSLREAPEGFVIEDVFNGKWWLPTYSFKTNVGQLMIESTVGSEFWSLRA